MPQAFVREENDSLYLTEGEAIQDEDSIEEQPADEEEDDEDGEEEEKIKKQGCRG